MGIDIEPAPNQPNDPKPLTRLIVPPLDRTDQHVVSSPSLSEGQ